MDPVFYDQARFKKFQFVNFRLGCLLAENLGPKLKGGKSSRKWPSVGRKARGTAASRPGLNRSTNGRTTGDVRHLPAVGEAR